MKVNYGQTSSTEGCFKCKKKTGHYEAFVEKGIKIQVPVCVECGGYRAAVNPSQLKAVFPVIHALLKNK